jgi:hypothetical protein
MPRTWLVGMLGLGVLACAGAAAGEPERADRWQLGNRALERTLVVGTLVEATIRSSGDTLTATVSTDVRNAQLWVVIPAGCPVGLRIALPSPAAQGAKMPLEVTSVTVWGQVYPVNATVELTPLAVVQPGTRILFVLPEGLTVERRFKDASLQIASSFDARQIRAPDHNC